MKKDIVQLECMIGERRFQFLCESNSTIVEVKEALSQFISYATQVANAAALEQQKKQEQEVSEVIDDLVIDDEYAKVE